MKNFKLSTYLTAIILFFFTASPLLAASSLNNVFNPVQGKYDSLGSVLQAALPIVFTLVAFLAVGVFALGAVKYIVSRGDPKATESARGTMTGAVIGLVIVLSTVAISSVLSATIGVSLFGTEGVSSARAPQNGSFDLSCAFLLSKDSACVGVAYGDPGSLVTMIMLLLVSVGAIAFFFMLLWNGFRYLTARGDDKAVGSARAGLTSAFIGLLLLIAAFAIIRLLATTLFGFKSF